MKKKRIRRNTKKYEICLWTIDKVKKWQRENRKYLFYDEFAYDVDYTNYETYGNKCHKECLVVLGINIKTYPIRNIDDKKKLKRIKKELNDPHKNRNVIEIQLPKEIDFDIFVKTEREKNLESILNEQSL